MINYKLIDKLNILILDYKVVETVKGRGDIEKNCIGEQLH